MGEFRQPVRVRVRGKTALPMNKLLHVEAVSEGIIRSDYRRGYRSGQDRASAASYSGQHGLLTAPCSQEEMLDGTGG